MSESVTAPWTCPTCHIDVVTVFCAICGEKHKNPREFTCAGLASMVFHAFSLVDGKLLRSVVALLRRLGALTVAFQRAQRLPYFGPFQLFLVINVLFFAVQSFTPLRVFTQTLTDRLSGELGDTMFQPTVNAHLAEIGKSFAEYAPAFDQGVAVNAKSLIGLMVPPFALLLPLVFWRKSQPLAVNMVFSLHFYAFLLLLFCVPMAVAVVVVRLGGLVKWPLPVDQATSIALAIASAVYLYVAIGPVFGSRGPVRVMQAAVLTSFVVGIFLIYRTILLPITLYTT